MLKNKEAIPAIKALIGKPAVIEIHMRAEFLIELEKIEESDTSCIIHLKCLLPVHEVNTGPTWENEINLQVVDGHPGNQDEWILEMPYEMVDSINPMKTAVSIIDNVVFLAKANGFNARLFFKPDLIKEKEDLYQEFLSRK